MKKRILHNKLMNINFPILALVLVLIIGILTLFINPIIGMADNGDFYRIINQNGLYNLNKNDNEIYLGYFIKNYGIYKYNNDYENLLTSTQSIFIKMAIFLDKIFTRNYIFDIRFMSAIFLIIESIAVYLLVKTLVNKLGNPKDKLIITLVVILIFCDTGYMSYYNSFYGEGVNICCFLLSIGLLMYMIEFNKFTWYNIIFFAISSFLFFGAKQQLAPMGILISFIFIIIASYKNNTGIKILSVTLSAIFIISSVMFYRKITGDFKYINNYHSMNRGILLNEDNAEDILKRFNINPQYSLLKETNFFEEIRLINPYDEFLTDDYYNKFSLDKVLTYYITNPKAFFKMLQFGFNNSYSIRPQVIGNYEKSQNKAFGEKSYFFAFWSTFKEKFIPKNILVTITTISIYLYISISRLIKGRKANNKKLVFKEEAYFYIFLTGLSQIIISVIGAGDADLAKHVFMYNMAFDLIFIYMFSLFLENKTESHKVV
ncbi:membrane protein [Clostridium sp. CTA-5]